MKGRNRLLWTATLAFLLQAQAGFGQQQQPQQQQRTRRSQRVRMERVEVVSPNGNLRFTLMPNAERLAFTVTMGETTVLDPSPLVMALDGYDLSTGVVLGQVERYQVDETYRWHGAKSAAVNKANGARISFENDLTSIPYTLDVRAYDDGVAYRHVIAGAASESRVPDEYSTFVVPAGSHVWYHDMEGHYEAAYEDKDISEVEPGEWSAPPLTIKLPGGAGYASITEANLVNYAGMGLEADGRRGWVVGLGHRQPLNYPFELRYGRDEGKRLGKAASVTGAIQTPWRVVMAGRDLNSLVNSTILPNLCPPPDPKYFPQGIETSWVKPGRAVWRYVDGGPEGFDGMKQFTDWAAKLGWEYHVLEGFWRQWTPEQRKEMADYARARGVELLFWRHSNQLRTAREQDEFFQMLNDAGVAGAKIDFFDHEAKELVDLYETLLEKAAARQLKLVFHGANKPSGRERTWPNDMVREGVRGMESRAFPARARHETILPFARYLAGAADYTTMIFSERRRDTSVAHQIATLAIFASPLLTVAANPETILANPAVDVIKEIPASWDETIVLPDSGIGELAAFARRTGDTWFLAVACGPEARTIKAPLSFLGEGTYKATLVRDDMDDDAMVRMQQGTHQRSDFLTITMPPGGGFVGRFQKN